MSSACGHQPRGEGEPRGRGGSLSLLGSCSSSPLTPPQFALYKKMTQAAILIQSKFRSYYEQKRFQQSRRAAVLIQQHYRSYRRRPGPPHRPPGAKYGLPPRPGLPGFWRGPGHGQPSVLLSLPFSQGRLSHQEAGPGSPEDHEVPAALPTQVASTPGTLDTPTPCGLLPASDSSRLCRMRELKQNQELEGLPQPGLAT